MSLRTQNYIDVSDGPQIIEMSSPDDYIGRDYFIIKTDDTMNTVTLMYNGYTLSVLNAKNETAHLIALASSWMVI